jgi:hypothetical protein
MLLGYLLPTNNRREKTERTQGTIVIDSASEESRVAMRAGNTEVGVCLAAVVTGLSMAGGW